MTIALMLAAALGMTDLDSLDRSIAAFTGAPAGQSGGAITPVDRRLRLIPCSMAPMLAWLSTRRDAVLVQCPDPGSWRLAVSVSRSGGGPADAPLVNRGDALTIEVDGDGFSVSRAGQAMDPGPLGAWIRVLPLTDGPRPTQPIRAQVVRPGLVRVPMG
jgi:flagella basal body P-ring formation protein FlgA